MAEQPKPTSPWVRRAAQGTLPYKVYADLHTDVRVVCAKPTLADILRRTLPPTDKAVR